MTTRSGGLIQENWSPKDYSFERSFGTSGLNVKRTPLGRKEKLDILGLPPIYQGNENTCVACSWAFIGQWLKANGKALDFDWLAKTSGTRPEGVKPSWVAETARLLGIPSKKARDKRIDGFGNRIAPYFPLESMGGDTVYQALKHGLVAVGVWDWNGVSGGHFLVIVDVNENGDWIAANWWTDGAQEYVTLPADTRFVEAIAIPDDAKDIIPQRLGVTKWLIKSLPYMLSTVGIRNRFIAATVGLLMLLGGVQTATSPSGTFGALGLPGKYRTALRQDITASASTIPVSSMTLRTGESVTTSTTQFPVYITINPGGTTEEDAECWGLDVAGPSFINCNARGLSLLGGNTTSTVAGKAYPHAQGETVILATTPYAFNRFVDNWSDQNVTGTKTFISNLLRIGDNATTTGAKYVYFRTNQANSPYLKVVGPQGSNSTSSFYISVDGTNDLQLNASGTVVGASTTGAIVIENGLTAWTPSTTGPLIVDSSNKAYLNVSTTGDATGGFMRINETLRRLYWDAASFLAGSWTWTSQQNLTGGATVPTPTSTTDVAQKGYTDWYSSVSVATGTAGMTISAGQLIALSPTTSRLIVANGSGTSTAWTYVGVAINSTTTGGQVSFSRPGGIAYGFSNLTPGSEYFLSTNGSLGNIPSSIPVSVGIAYSSSSLLLSTPSFTAIATGSFTSCDGSSDAVNIGFNPTKVSFSGRQSTGVGFSGEWFLLQSGASTTRWLGAPPSAGSVTFNTVGDGSVGEYVSGGNHRVYMVTSTGGFVVHCNNSIASVAVQYIAEYAR